MNKLKISELLDNVENGIENPFKGLSILKEMKSFLENAIKQIEPIAIDEAKKYDKIFESDGLKIEQRSGRKVWNFKKIDEVCKIKENLKEVEEKYKLAYSQFEKGLQVVDEHGELLNLPEVKYTNDVLIIKKLL